MAEKKKKKIEDRGIDWGKLQAVVADVYVTKAEKALLLWENLAQDRQDVIYNAKIMVFEALDLYEKAKEGIEAIQSGKPLPTYRDLPEFGGLLQRIANTYGLQEQSNPDEPLKEIGPEPPF